jgi:hypothetical protein
VGQSEKWKKWRFDAFFAGLLDLRIAEVEDLMNIRNYVFGGL